VVSIKHVGKAGEHCRTLTPEELAARPVHMRQARECARGRAPVRVRVSVDGQVVQARQLDGSGLFGDGPSIGVITVPVTPGAHAVRVELGETHDPAEWTHVGERQLDWPEHGRRVVQFDRATGFAWH
jgi:hypothetical protein